MISHSAATATHGQHIDTHGQHTALRNPMIYEQPLNERARSLLRMEFLFEQARAHTFRHSTWDSRAALRALFDLMSVFTRSDIKTEIMKELERQASFLDRLAENPQVDSSRLNEILAEMDALIDRLYTLQTQTLEFRDNDFLTSIKQRSTIAGGCCDFDLPAFHYWLSQPEEKRILDIQAWLEPFDPIRQAVILLLRLIRDSGEPTEEIASGGFFQRTLDPSHSCQLIRVALPENSPYFPEVSGSKHRFNIRFMKHSLSERPTQASDDIDFILTCCIL